MAKDGRIATGYRCPAGSRGRPAAMACGAGWLGDRVELRGPGARVVDQLRGFLAGREVVSEPDGEAADLDGVVRVERGLEQRPVSLSGERVPVLHVTD